MGVKTTVSFSRSEAEVKCKLYFEKAAGKVSVLSNEFLEYILEFFNDYEHYGEGYENYNISENIDV